jgi:hypothetical protein
MKRRTGLIVLAETQMSAEFVEGKDRLVGEFLETTVCARNDLLILAQCQPDAAFEVEQFAPAVSLLRRQWQCLLDVAQCRLIFFLLEPRCGAEEIAEGILGS